MNLGAALGVDEAHVTETLPAVRTLSLEKVKPSFSDYQGIIDARLNTASQIQVIDEDSQKLAVALVGEAKRIIKEIDTRKKALDEYREAKSFLDGLNGHVKMLTEKFEKIVLLVDPKVKQYTAKIELERREREKKAKEAAEALQKQINKEAEEKGVAAPTVIPPAIPKTDTIVRTETGTTAFAKRPWKFEIEDHEKVPREYCMPDNQKIRDAVKMGVREIPGVRIFEDIQMNYKS